MKKSNFLLLGAILCIFCGPSLAQRLPDPNAKITPNTKPPDPYQPPPLPDPTKGVNVPSLKSVYGDDLPEPTTARAMAERAKSGVDSLTDTVQRNQSMIRQLEGRVSNLTRQIQQLYEEMNNVLDDYRQGHFCSECGRSKREFTSEAAFWSHIAENAANGRHAIPAGPEKIAAKEKAYRNKIAALESERQSAQYTIGQKHSENQIAWDQIQQGLNLWRTATTLEHNLIFAREEAIKRRTQNTIKQALENLARVETELRHLMNQGPVEKAKLDSLNAERELWETIKRQALEGENQRVSYYWNELKVTNEMKVREFSQFSEYLQRTQEYGNVMRNLLRPLPSFSVSMSRVSVSFSSDQLGARFKFGSLVSGGISVGGIDATSSEARAFLELFSKVKFSAGWETRFTPDGVFTGPTFDVKLAPPKDGGGVNYPDKIEEKPKKGLPRP